MNKEKFMDVFGIILFYVIVLLGVVLVDARMAEINQANNTVETSK